MNILLEVRTCLKEPNGRPTSFNRVELRAKTLNY